MSVIKTIMNRDLRELWRSIPFKIMLLVFFLLVVGALIITSIILSNIYSEINMLDNSTITNIMKDILSHFVIAVPIYFLSMLPYIVFVWVFLYVIMGKEKSSGNIETLLATPLSPIALVIGKSLAIFIPGLLISIVSTLLLTLFLNTITSIMISSIIVVIPMPILITSLVVNSVIFFAFIILTNVLAFIKNPDIAIIPSFLLGFGIMIGIPIGLGLEVFDIGSWIFTLYYSAGCLLLWLIIIISFHFLEKERIILSSKTDL